MNDRPLSQTEAYKVADWLKQKGKDVEAALKNLWRKRPSEIARKYKVDQKEVAKAADREA
jgi:hypothetical protein